MFLSVMSKYITSDMLYHKVMTYLSSKMSNLNLFMLFKIADSFHVY